MRDLVFFHCSDIHLGKTYVDSAGREERYEDFFRVFTDIIRQAVAEAVDGVLIAGDLFHYPQILPRTLARTVDALKPLQQARIPVVAVEGNHDWIHRRESVSWIEALSDMGYIHLLRPTMDAQGRYTFSDWNAERKCGGRMEIGGVHFYGVGYIGALAGSHIERIIEAARETEENVLLFHVGVWGYCGTDIGTMSPEESRPLAETFKYVALGHGHKSYQVVNGDGLPYAFNPGSPERVNFGEAHYAFKGFHRIRWSAGGRPVVEPVRTEPRPMIDLAIALDGSRNLDEAVARVQERLADIKGSADSRRPVVRIKLTGRVGFRPMEMSRQKITAIAEAALHPLHVEYENALGFSLTTKFNQTGHVLSLRDVERDVVHALFAAQSAYQSGADQYARLALQVKDAVQTSHADPAEILDMIHRELQAAGEPAASDAAPTNDAPPNAASDSAVPTQGAQSCVGSQE